MKLLFSAVIIGLWISQGHVMKSWERFGLSLIKSDQLQRLAIYGEIPLCMKRGLVDQQIDLDVLLDAIDLPASRRPPIYVYTGRGPSSLRLHWGHPIPFQLANWLSGLTGGPLHVQLSNDEKFYASDTQSLLDIERFTVENERDIRAICNTDRLFMSRNTQNIADLYTTAMPMAKALPIGTLREVFGLDDSAPIGRFLQPLWQMAPCFADPDPRALCVVACAVDQYPYFRVARAVAERVGKRKPIVIAASQFIPALDNPGSKMSASSPKSCIFFGDTPEVVHSKLSRAVSGGGRTIEEHRERGGDTSRDVAMQLLRAFLEDEAEWTGLVEGYKRGIILTAQVKKRAIGVVNELLAGIEKRRNESIKASCE